MKFKKEKKKVCIFHLFINIVSSTHVSEKITERDANKNANISKSNLYASVQYFSLSPLCFHTFFYLFASDDGEPQGMLVSLFWRIIFIEKLV